MSNSLAKTESTELGVAKNIEGMLEAAQYLIDNDLIPKARSKPKAEEVVMTISTGQSLGMDPITAVNSIDLIQGRVSIQSRIIPGLLSRKGIAVRLVKDYEPVMGDPIPMRDDDGKPIIDDDGVVKYYKDPDGNYLRKEVDRVTTLEFIRDFGGDIGVVKNQISFYLSDARNAGWYPDKDNWVKLTRFMMYARCLARGARAFASDAISGMYDSFEVAEFSNVGYGVTDDGDIVIEDTDYQDADHVTDKQPNASQSK